MLKLLTIATALSLAAPIPARAQSKADCAKLAASVPSLSVAIGNLETKLTGVPWEKVTAVAVNADLKAASQEARIAQAELVAAMRRYRNLLEDVTHMFNLCAR